MDAPIFLFDVDGVIMRDKWRFSAYFYEREKLSAPVLEEFFANDFPKTLRGELDARMAMRKRLAGSRFADETDAIFKNWFEFVGELDPEAFAISQRLREAGHVVWLATNKDRAQMEHLWNERGFSQRFDAAYPSYEAGYTKSDIRYFHWVMRRVYEDFGARQIIFVDDMPGNIDRARECDWIAHCFRREEPDAVVKLEAFLAPYSTGTPRA